MDGSLAEVESQVWSLDTNHGRMYTVLVRDIAERKQRERELLELNKSLYEFAAIAAHDLLSPIAAIRGFLELLEDGALDRNDKHDLSIIKRIEAASDRGIQLIDDLLSYSRAGQTTLETERIDVTDLARAAADSVTTRTERPCTIEVSNDLQARGAKKAVRQVLENLIYNAVHYCPADREPIVKVDALTFSDSAQTVIRVSDNGSGILPEERERIFEMFQRGTAGASKSGTGVDLAFCRRVIERHGGTIWVEDAPGGGSRFCFALPRQFGESQLADANRQAASSRPEPAIP